MHLVRTAEQKKTSRIRVRFRRNLSKLVALMILALVAIPALPTHAQPSYLPGVHVGDSVTYGEISGNVSPFNVTSSIVLTITSVTGAVVAADLKFNFRNGTIQTLLFISNVQNSNFGNASFIVIAGGLSAGDPLTPTSSPSSFFGFVTETVSRAYAGALRSTNEFAVSQTFNGQTSSIGFSWDQASGVLVELSEYLIGQGSAGQTLFAHIKATSTNVWTPSTIPDFGFDAISLTNPILYLGQSANYILNLTSFQGFSGKVGLSASLTNSSLAQPPALSLGASSVNVASNGFATTMLTFSTNSSTKLGVYLFSVHSGSGSITHDALFAVSVQPPSFALSATPVNLTVAGGSSTSSTITIKSLGIFSGFISLSASSSNPSITASLTPTIVHLSSTVMTANSTLTVSVAPYVLPGDNSIYVSAVSGQIQQSVNVPVTVSGPHFQLFLNTTFLTVPAGKSAAISVTLQSISGFTGMIGLTDSSYGPLAISLSQTNLFLSPGGSAKAVLTILVAPSATAGSYLFASVTGISGLLQQNQGVSIQVAGSASGFSISSNPNSLSIAAGRAGNFTVSLSSNGGFAGHIALAAQFNYGSPMGYVFSSTNVTLPAGGTATSTLTVSAPTTFPFGSAGLNVYANSGNLSQSLFLYVNVGTSSFVGGPDFFVYSSPSSLTLRPGTSGNSTITVGSINGFTGNVTLTMTQIFGVGCPGSSCPTASLIQKALELTSASTNSTTLSVSVPSTTPTQSSYNLQVIASNGTFSRSTYLSIAVCPCPRFDVSFNANNVPIIQGTNVSPTIIVSSIQGFSGTVSLHLSVFGGPCFSPNPKCPSVSLAPTTVSVPANGTAISSITIRTNSSTAVAYYNVEVVANSTLATIYSYFSFNVVSLSTPDVGFSTVPNPLIITPGSSGLMSIFLTSINGFNSKLTVSYPGFNAGISVSPKSLNLTLAAGGSAASTLTITAGPNAPRGYTNVQLSATNGTLNRQFYLPVFVAAPDFNVVAGQTFLSIQAGGNSATTTLTIPSLDGLQGAVALKATAQPCFNGVCPSVSFSPPNPSLTPGGWTLSNITVSAALGTSSGYYTIAVNATSGSVIHIIDLTVYVAPSTIQIPDFSIFASPSFLTVTQGGARSSTITLTSVNGFKGTLSLASNAPSGVAASLVLQTLQLKSGGTNSTSLSVSVPSTTPTGFYYVTVTGANSTISHSVTVSVQVVGPDFSISAQPSLVTVPQGKSVVSTITLKSLAGFAGTVNLSVSGSLAASFNKNSVILSPGGTASSNLTISGFTNYPGLYYVTVTAFSGTVSHYLTIIANVTGPDFRISAKPANLTIAEGKSGFSTITLTGIEGFSGPILLSSSSYYYGVTFETSVTPSTMTLNSTATTATASLNVTVPATLVPGSFNYVVVTGTNGILSHTIYIPVTVTGPDFSLASSPTFLNVHQGKNATSTISLASLDGFHGTVNLSATSYGGLLVSINSTVTLTAGGTGIATLAISATNATTLGGHYVYVTGTSGILSHYLYVYVNVTGPDFRITASQYSFTLMRGQNANSTITLHSIDQFSGTVRLTAPISGIKVILSSANVTLTPTTTATSILHISINSTVSNGFYYFTVTGTSGILSHSIFIYVNVVGPDFTISTTPYFFSITQGQTQTFSSKVTMASFNGFTGNLTLSVSPGGLNAILSKTSLILISGGTASANLTITVPTNATIGYHYVTVRAVNGSIVRTASVAVYVFPIPQPDFSLTVVPSSETLLAGTTGNYSVILTSFNGFSGTVSLNVTSSNGFTGVFSPQRLTLPAGGQVSASLALSIPSSTLTGFYYILVTATNSSGAPVHSVSIGASVLAQNFTLSAVPTSVIVQAGSNGKSIIAAVGLNGFSGTVNLTLTYDSQQIAAILGTTSLKIITGFANSTVLTISTSISTVPGTYHVLVNGTIASLSRTVTITVYVTPSGLQHTSTILTCSTPVTLNQASNCTATVTSTAPSGATNPSGIVNFTTNSTGTFSPSTATCTLVASSVIGRASCSLTYTPGVAGHHMIMATYDGDSTHTTSNGSFNVTAAPAFDYSLSNNSPVSIQPGGSGAVTITATLTAGTAQFVTLSCSGLPSGISCVFNPNQNPVLPTGSSSLTIDVASSAAAGSYSFQVVGTPTGATVSGAKTTVNVTVSAKATPTITSTLTPGSIAIGGSATDLASLTGGSSPTGTMTYTAYSDSACTTLVFTSASIALGTSSGPFTPSAVGTYLWIASYSGDSNNNPVSTTCGAAGETLTVSKSTSTIGTSLSSAAITVGSSTTDSSTLASTFKAGGSVTYIVYASATACTGVPIVFTQTVPVSNGVVPNSRPVVFNNTGIAQWQAVYSGDANNSPVTSACGTELLTVVKTTTTTTTTLSSSSIVVGMSASDSVSISGFFGGFSPGGTVSFNAYSGTACTGTLVFSQTVNVNPTTGVAPGSRAAEFNSTGTYEWQAVYSGDGNNEGSMSLCGSESLAVNKATPTLLTILSSNSITIGNSVSDSAALTGSFQAAGTLSYSVFSNNICTAQGKIVSTVAVTGGVVPNSRLVTFNSTGDFGFQASYGGDSNNIGVTSSCEPLTVSTGVSIQTTLSALTVTVGGSVMDSATLAGQSAAAGGMVTYTDFNNAVCAAPVTTVSVVAVTNGVVPNSRAVIFNSTGSFSFQAVYSGDANDNSAVSPCEALVVQKASPSIATSLSSTTISVGQSVTDSATLSTFFQAGGGVTYNVFTNGACTPAGIVASVVAVTNGVVPNSRAVTFNATGSYAFQAVYFGDVNNNGATGPCEPLSVTSAGQPVLLTFKGFDLDDYDNGIGQLQVLVNGHLVVDIPAGLNHLSGSGDYSPYTDRWVNFGPFDITNFVVKGQNNITFTDRDPVDHFGRIRNVTIVQGTTVLLNVARNVGIYPGFSKTYTFSIPPLTITSFTISPTVAASNRVMTFTATYTGGTAPFTCIFRFGDGESVMVAETSGTCTATHSYLLLGTFMATVIVRGTSTSDLVRSSLTVTIT